VSRLAATVTVFAAACLLGGCTKPLPVGAHDAGGDVGSTGDVGNNGDVGATGDGDLPDAHLDLALEIDCPDCNGFCGDGVLKIGEQCDDGNRNPGDGCTALCQVLAGWTCPVPGMPCQYLPPNPDASP